MADGPSGNEIRSSTTIIDADSGVWVKDNLSWLKPEERAHFARAYCVSEGDGNAVDITNSVNFLEGFLSRTKFPDDDKAEKLKKRIEGLSARAKFDTTMSHYSELRALRAAYVGTRRGDLEGRVERLRAREAKMVVEAQKG